MGLLGAMNRGSGTSGDWDNIQRRALELAAGQGSKDAFDMHREPAKVRGRYGMHPLTVTWAPTAARVLIIGLGGGSFSDFLAEVYPQWSIDVVEINPAVIRLAKKYFPIDKRVNIIEADGRAFLAKTKNKYDVILMDAFGEHYIPPEIGRAHV